jgi:hypothetical protein
MSGRMRHRTFRFLGSSGPITINPARRLSSLKDGAYLYRNRPRNSLSPIAAIEAAMAVTGRSRDAELRRIGLLGLSVAEKRIV